MYRTKTLTRIINMVGQSLYEVAKGKDMPKTTFSAFSEGYVLGSYKEERTNPNDPDEPITVEVLIYVDEFGVKYKVGDGVPYTDGSISALLEIMNDMQLHTPEADALRDYINAYNMMKKLAWGKK